MKKFALLIVALAAVSFPVAAQNSLTVNNAAALGGSGTACAGSNCGLQVSYDNGAGNLVFVQTNALQDETGIRLQFIIDPGIGASTRLDQTPGGNTRIVNLYQNFQAGGTKVVIFLRRSLADNAWRLSCYVRDDFGNFQFGGEGYLTGLTPTAATIVTVEWGAASAPGANDGFVRATRALVANPNEFTIFDNSTLDNDTHTLGVMRVGKVENNDKFVIDGELYLDEFVITRL